jgi:hypothetical protein
MDADFIYSVIFMEEISKCESGGFMILPAVQQFMSSPYIAKHGSEFLKEKYLTKAISGEWIFSIGISEPNAGSDVANIRTTAIREGDHYVVNGSKTFITNGVYGDVLVLVCKTDPEKGAAGVSLIVMDLDSPGVSRTKLKKLGWHASDTAELAFDNVKVPVENLIGDEGQGLLLPHGWIAIGAPCRCHRWFCLLRMGVAVFHAVPQRARGVRPSAQQVSSAASSRSTTGIGDRSHQAVCVSLLPAACRRRICREGMQHGQASCQRIGQTR